jgi:hypothetical protein
VTEKNIVAGVKISNAYATADIKNLDLSGIQAKEGNFLITDRYPKNAQGDASKAIEIKAAPTNKSGDAIDLEEGLYISFWGAEKVTRNYLFGATKGERSGVSAVVATSRYGFETELAFTLVDAAKADLRDGETLTENGNFWTNAGGNGTAALSWAFNCIGRGFLLLFSILF